jgi:hypothetical protein
MADDDIPEPEAASPPSSDPGEPERFDLVFILAQIRGAGDRREEAIKEAYRRTFQTEMGRLVMLDHLMRCGVGRLFGDRAGEDLMRAVGMHDSAIMLANDAGFDEAAIAATLLTQELTEEPNERYEHGPAGPAGPAAAAVVDDDTDF